MRNRRFVWALSTVFLLAQSTAYAWDSTGHRAVAYIAYKQLKQKDAATLKKVLDVLRTHPAVPTGLWKNAEINGDDADLNLFLNAATFPDDVRSGHLTPHTRFNDDAFKTYQHGNDHFINFRFQPSETDPANTEPAGIVKGGTIAPTYMARVKAIKENDPGDLKNDDNTPETRAVSLSWIFHQVGDVHQPLHAAARFSPHFTTVHGDEGGNKVVLSPSRRGADELHAYWDGLLGSDHQVNTPEKLASVVDSVQAAFPPEGFSEDDLKPANDLTGWAKESFRLAVEQAYVPLGKELDSDDGVNDLPAGYEEQAIKTAKRRVALAGYRLAAEMKAIFASSNGNN